MKRRLLFLSIAVSIISFNASAQVISFPLENFNSLTEGSFPPSGWTEFSDGHTVGAFASGIPALGDSLDHHAWVPWLTTSSSSDMQMITTSLFTPTATAARYLCTPAFTVMDPHTVLQWDDYDLGSGENLEILISPTGATTSTGSYSVSLYSAAAGSSQLTTHQLPIGNYNGTSISAAFVDNTNNNWGEEIDNVEAISIDSLDCGVTTINLAPFAKVGTAYPITGYVVNYGYDTVNSIDMVYSVNGTIGGTNTMTGMGLPLGYETVYTCTPTWTPSAAGTYTIKVWGDNLNGHSITDDQNHANDTATTTVIVVDTLEPKLVMVEEFNQASCDPCAEATPNLDSVLNNNAGIVSIVRYHVNFPGRDCMDSVTLAPFVSSRLSYYSVNGVPDAQVDGIYCYPGAGYFTSSVLQTAASAGSPFKITITPNYDWTTQTYSFSAVIKAYGALPAGLTAYAALTVDTLTYARNQSTESIPQYSFPQVAENMFPAAGTSLSAFTDGSTQTVTGTWVKNHPWGSDYAVWSYDSTTTGKIVVWIENSNFQGAPYVYQSSYVPIPTAHVHTAGVNTVVGNNASMDLYPNPASKVANVALTLNTDEDVKLEVYNTLGQLVFSMPSEHRNSGTSSSAIDVSSYAPGQYFVKVTVGTECLTKPLLIAK